MGDGIRRALPPMRWRVMLLYAWALVREFRGTLIALAIVEVVGAVLYLMAPESVFDGHREGVLQALYATWMAMFAQPVGAPYECWYIASLAAIYPLVGIVIIGEGVVRLAILMVSRREGEKEWTRVMASTYRDHVILCGLGHLGFRILQELTKAGVEVVALEKDAQGRFVADAKATGAPIVICDAKEDQTLIDAGIERARCIIVATNDDLANLEVALDARRMNPKIQVMLRMFDQQIAAKISGAMAIDVAFSASALAAPVVAAMCHRAQILASYPIAGVPHVTARLMIEAGSQLVGQTIGQLTQAYAATVVAHNPTGEQGEAWEPSTVLEAGDELVVHIRAGRLAELSAASHGASAGMARGKTVGA